MRRIIFLLLLSVSAFAAEVQFYFVPTGTCAIPSSVLCDGITAGGTTVWIFPSTDLASAANSYAVTVSFTITRPDGSTSARTMTEPVYPLAWDRSVVGAALLGWAVADIPNVTVTSVSVVADAGQVQVAKTAKNPVSGLATGMLVLNNGWSFLPKPFVSEMLRDRIRDFLSEQPPMKEHLPVV